MNADKKSPESGALQPLRPLEKELIRARAINASAVTAPGVIMGNRAFVQTWEMLRTRSRPGNTQQGK